MRKKEGVWLVVGSFLTPIINYPLQEVVLEKNSKQIIIGEVVNPVNGYKSIGIDIDNLFEHILVIGSTGSGKTYTVSRIITRAYETNGINAIVFDWHGEYYRLLRKYNYYTPYDLPVNVFSSDKYLSLEVLSDVLELTPPQTYVLERILREHSIETLYELVNVLENSIDESSWMRESRYALLRKLYPLIREKYLRIFGGKDKDLGVRKNGINVIDLSVISDNSIRRVYASLVLKHLFLEAVSTKSPLNTLVVLEEAQNYVSRESPLRLIRSMLAEVRKFRIGLIIVSQSPSLLAEDVMVNTNTKIIHSMKSHRDLEVVSKILYSPEEIQRVIPYLGVGEAILYTRNLKKPIIIKIT
ncbi:MAG: DUF87 domain-containing protein [Thermoprotei archaeon]